MRAVSLRVKILAPLLATFLILFASFVISTYSIRHKDISYLLEVHYQESVSHFNQLLTSKNEWLCAISENLIKDPLVLKALRAQDRGALYLATRSYSQKFSAHGISVFLFHSLDGRNFFRVYQPDYFGKVVVRDSFKRAIRSGVVSYGLEMGDCGALMLRTVIPLQDQLGKLGFLELGVPVDQLLRSLGDLNHVDYALALDKHLLQRDLWENGMSRLGKTPNWEQYPHEVLISQSLSSMPVEVDKELAQQTPQHSHDSGWSEGRLGQRRFAFKNFPLLETSGREIGRFILLYDVSRQISQGNTHIRREIIFGLGLCLILSLFAWQVLGRVQKTVIQTQQALADKVTDISEANLQLEHEIAERSKAEAALFNLNTHLEERIEERTAHLEALSRELEERRNELEHAYTELKSRQAMILHQDKMASVGLLAAGVAHDINNPIGFVVNNLEELRVYLGRLQSFIELQAARLQQAASPELLEQIDKERRAQAIDTIFEDFGTLIAESLEGTSRVSSIVKNLRNFSRVDDDSYCLADINECLESAIRITHHELRHKAIIHRHFGELPALYCCPQQLNQVFMNLLVNASHALEKRGEITIRSWADQKTVYVAIQDTGCGIPEQILSRIFEPFFTTKDISKGTGLGLSIVSDIIREHGGDVTVTSKEGLGTTFTILLPIREEARND